MEEKIYNNVCILGTNGNNKRSGKSIAMFAIDYFLEETLFSIPSNTLKIIFSYNLQKEVFSHHVKPDFDMNPNATFIPTYFQKEESKENGHNLIIINMKKLDALEANDYFVCSCIVHELMHYYDFEILYKELQNEYGLSLDEIWNYALSEYHKQIYNLFFAYSEIHAKYMQEKYYLKNYLKIDFERYLIKFNEKLPIFINKQCSDYDIQHTIGCLMAWNEIFSDKRQLKSINRIVNNYLKNQKTDEQWKIYFELTSKENLHKIIQQIEI